MFANFWRKLRSKPELSPGRKLGNDGERLAAEYLRGRGMRVLEKNWKCAVGEIDLICRNGEQLVFVEVKSSLRLSSVPPEDRVGAKKQRKLVTLAQLYMKQHDRSASCRFDVVAVWWEESKPVIRHIENAFTAKSS